MVIFDPRHTISDISVRMVLVRLCNDGGLMTKRPIRQCAMMVVVAVATVAAVEVVVRMDSTFQVIDGMGATGDVHQWKIRQGPFLVDADLSCAYDSLIEVLGGGRTAIGASC